MNYEELKPIFDVKTFNILQNLTKRPTCDLFLPDNTSIDEGGFDPFDETSTDVTNMSPGEDIFIKNVPCIYTHDKIVITNNDNSLGSKYSLTVYVRADDMPQQVIDEVSSTIIKFQGIKYPVESFLNLYDILQEFRLT